MSKKGKSKKKKGVSKELRRKVIISAVVVIVVIAVLYSAFLYSKKASGNEDDLNQRGSQQNGQANICENKCGEDLCCESNEHCFMIVNEYRGEIKFECQIKQNQGCNIQTFNEKNYRCGLYPDCCTELGQETGQDDLFCQYYYFKTPPAETRDISTYWCLPKVKQCESNEQRCPPTGEPSTCCEAGKVCEKTSEKIYLCK